MKEAKQMVMGQAFQMKRSLDSDNIMDALKHASNMISELRTGLLHPRSYYDLYILVFDQLRHLEMYISEGNHKRSLHELYELVQYAGNILPRLYLLITVGSVYIKKMEAPAKDVLYDVVELCRGVQHPTRGLFLRTYLSEMTKDKLPDEGSKYEGDVTDSIDFIIANFIEMNKLWVRMQHGIRDLDKREQEREELHILVGKNLSRLSQLEGLTIGLYKSDVLPRVLQQIITCKDRIAQQNLMVIIIQAFSDEFHLRTLDQLLDTCNKLQEDVDVQSIISSLIDRLANYCLSTGTVPTEIDIFELFHSYVNDLAENRKSLTLEAILELGRSLMSLALKCYKDEIAYVDKVYQYAAHHINIRKLPDDSKTALQQILKLLQYPAEHTKSIRILLSLQSYTKVLSLLSDKDRKTIALFIVSHLLKNDTQFANTQEVAVLFSYLTPLTYRETSAAGFNEEDWHDDQTQISYVISMLNNSDLETMAAILQKTKELFTNSKDVNIAPKYTLVPLTFKALALVQKVYKKRDEDLKWEAKAKFMFKYANDTISGIKTSDVMTAYNLYLQCTLQASQIGLSEYANGFLVQGALVLIEDEQITQSKQEYSAITQLIAVVHSINCLDDESYINLCRRIATQHSSKLLVLDYQSRATLLSTNLFVTKNKQKAGVRDPKSGLTCLKKAVTIAGTVVDVEVLALLYVFILDYYVYFYDLHPDMVEAKFVNGVISKINKHISSNNIDKNHGSLVHYRNIVSFVAAKQNWENLVKKEKTKKEGTKEGIEVEREGGLSEADAKTEAQRWAEIVFDPK
uniref:Vacuolar protein sorting-associated protein 35 n=1 Tax=Arcella intermedia TaxID=1963864 RepID=A0A6B2KXW5_9EUKA